MPDFVPDNAIDRWETWQTDPRVFGLLLSSYPEDTTDEFIDDVAAYELTVTGYTRWVAVNPLRIPNLISHQIEYYLDVDDGPDFGSPDPGETFGWMFGAINTGNDATARLVGLWRLDNQATSSDPVRPYIGPAGLVAVATTP